ncbi:MAG: hypothetical protein HZA01_12825 [Nitrospinae bacterium]|nr:hypothetical protein [Nitrospinota bacterium]
MKTAEHGLSVSKMVETLKNLSPKEIVSLLAMTGSAVLGIVNTGVAEAGTKGNFCNLEKITVGEKSVDIEVLCKKPVVEVKMAYVKIGPYT